MTDTRRDSETPLESWKAIAAYLQREVRTVRRWEHTERLPVHRHQHLARSTVYAYPSELDAWRESRKPTAGASVPSSYRVPARIALVAATLLAVITAGGGRVMTSGAPADQDGGQTHRVVWEGAASEVDPWTGQLSPDGRFLSFIHWDNGNLAVRDLVTGESRDVTRDGGYEICSQYGWESAWSPDGATLAYHWFSCDEDRPHHSLRVIGADGTNQRVLLRSDEVIWPAPVGWTPDGSRIVVIVGRADRTWQIGLVRADDGSLQVLKTLDWRKPDAARLSPDGRHVVYDAPVDPDDNQRDLYLLALDGSRETALVRHPANDRAAVWTPAGDAIVFASNRSGVDALWRLAVSDGAADGAPSLIRETSAITLVGFAPDGRLYYGAQFGGHNVWTVGFDPLTGSLSEDPELLPVTYQGRNAMPEWSPDGRELAYLSLRGLRGSTPGRTNATLVLRDVATGAERTLNPELEFCDGCGLRWSPDGGRISAIGTDSRGRSGVYLIDVDTGAITPVSLGGGRSWWAAWMPDGESLAFHRIISGADASITAVVRRVADGREHALIEGENIGMLAISPDGQLVAYARTFGSKPADSTRDLVVRPVASGEPRVVAGPWPIRGPHWWEPRYIVWSPDGRYLIFGGQNSVAGGEPEHHAVWRVPAGGGDPVLLARLPAERPCDLRMAPDGRTLAFDNCAPGLQQLWAAEHVLDGTGGLP